MADEATTEPLTGIRYDKASLVSQYIFSYVNPLLDRAEVRPLEEQDAEWITPPSDEAHELAATFQRKYEEVKIEYASPPPGSLRRPRKPWTTITGIALLRLNFWPMFWESVWVLLEVAQRLGTPVALREFLRWLQDYSAGKSPPPWRGWMWAVVLAACGSSMAIIHHQLFFIGMRCGFTMRQQTIAAIHAKVLRLNSAAVSALSTGHVVNLVSNDVRRFDDVMPFWMFLWAAPLELAMVLLMVSLELDFLAALAGVATSLAMIPLQSALVRYIGGLRRNTARCTDERVRLAGEVVEGSLAMKMLGWEDPFADALRDIRARETFYSRRMQRIRGINFAMQFAITPIVAFVTFAVYRARGGVLNVASVFYALSLLHLPKLYMVNFFVVAVQSLTELRVSLQRIDTFLSTPEPSRPGEQKQPQQQQQDASSEPKRRQSLQHGGESGGMGVIRRSLELVRGAVRRSHEAAPVVASAAGAGGESALPDGYVAMRGADYDWARPFGRDDILLHDNHGKALGGGGGGKAAGGAAAAAIAASFSAGSATAGVLTLCGVRFAAAPGELLGVCGSVGSGKSSLLAALLGELQPLRGPQGASGDGGAGFVRIELEGSGGSGGGGGGGGGCGDSSLGPVMKGRVAYCAQVPWIVAGSVRENITFGSPWDEHWYGRVVHACCLTDDLASLPAGDATELGERGINLSGGQKARVALARAVYCRPSVALLDDPLSAVDPRVGRDLFARAIGPGSLLDACGTTRLLVTHQRQYLPKCDRLLVLRGGRTVALGPLREVAELRLPELTAGHGGSGGADGGAGGDVEVADATVDEALDDVDLAAAAAATEALGDTDGGGAAAASGTGAAGTSGDGAESGGGSSSIGAGAIRAVVTPNGDGAPPPALSGAAPERAPDGTSAEAATGGVTANGAHGALADDARAGLQNGGSGPKGEKASVPGATTPAAAVVAAAAAKNGPPRAAGGSFGGVASRFWKARSGRGQSRHDAETHDANGDGANNSCGNGDGDGDGDGDGAGAGSLVSRFWRAGGGGGGGEAGGGGGRMWRLGSGVSRGDGEAGGGGGGRLASMAARYRLSLSRTFATGRHGPGGKASGAEGDAAAGGGPSTGKPGAKLVTDEDRVQGTVAWSVYGTYCRHMGLIAVALICCGLVAGQAVFLASEWWLALWAKSNPVDQERDSWLWVYGMLTGIVIVIAFLRSVVFFEATVAAATSIHNSMARRVLRAPLSFFHTNPSGRIVNRFSKDQGQVDDLLPSCFFDALQSAFQVFGAFVLAAIAVPVILPVFLPLVVAFYLIRRRYITASREIKRWEAVSRSPVYAAFSATLKGLPTIRAYGAASRFDDTFLKLMAHNGNWYFAFMSSARWIGVRLDTVAGITLLAAALLAVAMKDRINTAVMALALTHVMQLTGFMQWVVRQTAEVENTMTCVERMVAYTRLPSEPPRVGEGAAAPLPGWPRSGALTYRDVTAVYRPGLPPVLSGLSFSLRAGTSCGVVGRTGSGKSSLLLTLFRLIPVTGGSISLDGVDTAGIGLDALRRQLAIIPQDPVLFSGTLRSNLDPWRTHDDGALWGVLEAVQLRAAVAAMPGGLDAAMSECGGNLSVGQRQLFCLARALLQDAKVLALDEATANVDRATDELIQTALCDFAHREREVHGRVLLVIAHRIDTILDTDHLLVLAGGRLVESGPPRELAAQGEGVFARMVAAARLAAAGAKDGGQEKGSGAEGREEGTGCKVE